MGLSFPLRRKDDLTFRQRRRMRRGLYILPSLFTSLNIAAGYWAMAQVLQGSAAEPWHFDNAAKAIGLAILADGLDGRVARMTNTTSEFGRELDSLADVITFGVAPALLAWAWGFRMLPTEAGKLIHIGAIISFIFLTAGASRLARFNIQKNPKPSNPGRPGRKYFVGMPIPAGAGVICAVVHVFEGNPLTLCWQGAIWIGFVLAAALLMVSTWRFYSGKELDLRARHPFWLILLFGGMIALIWYFSRWTLLAMGLAYMFSGVLMRLLYPFRRRTAPVPPVYPETREASNL
jgi:CDP-diacylglycerol--serine O-phosphatidyltransferase